MTSNVVEKGHAIIKQKLWDERKNKPSISVGQIRKFLSAVNGIQNKLSVIEGNEIPEEIADEIQYLRIKLAYQTGRNRVVEPLQKELDPIIREIGRDKKKFNNFSKLMESIVAYHKFYGGDN
jgi:CRISPR-associated protein Csm2